MGNPSECSWFAIHDEGCQVIDVSNYRQDGIPLSLQQCGDCFSPMPIILINNFILMQFYLYKAQHHSTAPCGNIRLLVRPWYHKILGTKWRRKNVVSPKRVRHLRIRQHFQRLVNFEYRFVSSVRNNIATTFLSVGQSSVHLQFSEHDAKCFNVSLLSLCNVLASLSIPKFLPPDLDFNFWP